MKGLVSSIATPLKILIVDDEPSAREFLREMLADEAERGAVEIVGECMTGQESVEVVQAAQPDLVFLDVQMPEMNGFDVLAALSSEQSLPFVVFVTAYDQYALRAFEVQALDYLLKPFDRERFSQVFERAKKTIAREREGDWSERILMMLAKHNDQVADSATAAPEHYLERLIIKTDGRVFFLRAEEIVWIKAEGNYVLLHTDKKSHLFRESISALEKKLNPRKFLRIHRSSVVNLDFVKELQPLFRGEYQVIMRDGTELKLSHNYRNNLQQNLGGIL